MKNILTFFHIQLLDIFLALICHFSFNIDFYLKKNLRFSYCFDVLLSLAYRIYKNKKENAKIKNKFILYILTLDQIKWHANEIYVVDYSYRFTKLIKCHNILDNEERKKLFHFYGFKKNETYTCTPNLGVKNCI